MAHFQFCKAADNLQKLRTIRHLQPLLNQLWPDVTEHFIDPKPEVSLAPEL